jgi:hypothetical protein
MDQGRTKRGRLLLVISLFAVLLIGCAAAIYWIGDLTKFQEVVSAKESQAALRDLNDPGQIEAALARYPSNKFLKLMALARKASLGVDAGIDTLLNEEGPKNLDPSKPIDLGALARGDLEALEKDLKAAQGRTSTEKDRCVGLIKAERDKLARDARALGLGDDTVAAFMAIIDDQNGQTLDLVAKMLAARDDYYRGYEQRVALLRREFGIYRVTNGQIIFPFPSTADSYNRAAAAMAAATNQMAELEREKAALRQAQFNGWKAFVDQQVTGKRAP